MASDGLDPYRSLAVGPRASPAEIRTAYLNLARLLHPDLFRNAPEGERRLAERRMREVNEAYAMLRDPERRASYDRSSAATKPRGGTPPFTTERNAAHADAPSRTSPPTRPREWSERFDADPFARPEFVDPEDDLEVSPAVAFLLHRGPLIAVLALALLLFIVTAYAGGKTVVEVPQSSITTSTCLSTTVGTSGSPC